MRDYFSTNLRSKFRKNTVRNFMSDLNDSNEAHYRSQIGTGNKRRRRIQCCLICYFCKPSFKFCGSCHKKLGLALNYFMQFWLKELTCIALLKICAPTAHSAVAISNLNFMPSIINKYSSKTQQLTLQRCLYKSIILYWCFTYTSSVKMLQIAFCYWRMPLGTWVVIINHCSN